MAKEMQNVGNAGPIDDEFDVDEVIQQLLSVRTKNPGPSNMVDLDVDLIYKIIDRALPIVSEQPMLLRLKAPLVVGTDIHGQFYDLLRFMTEAGYPP